MLDILIFDSLLWRQKEAVRQGYEGYYYNINKKDGVVLGNADLNSKGWADKVTEGGGLNLNLSNEKGDKQLPKYAYLRINKKKISEVKGNYFGVSVYIGLSMVGVAKHLERVEWHVIRMRLDGNRQSWSPAVAKKCEFVIKA